MLNTPVTRDELYLGGLTPTGKVTATQWAQFVAREVAPRFPSGFTVTRSQGAWRMADGKVVREPTRILTVYYDGANVTATHDVAAIANAYRKTFAQEAVLRITGPATASLVTA